MPTSEPPSDVYDPSVQRWYCLACDMEHPPGPCPFEEIVSAEGGTSWT